VLYNVVDFILIITQYLPLTSSTYILTPRRIDWKHAVINVCIVVTTDVFSGSYCPVRTHHKTIHENSIVTQRLFWTRCRSDKICSSQFRLQFVLKRILITASP